MQNDKDDDKPLLQEGDTPIPSNQKNMVLLLLTILLKVYNYLKIIALILIIY